MIRIIAGVLVSSALSSGMVLLGRGFLVPPSSGSPDSPIPLDDYFEGLLHTMTTYLYMPMIIIPWQKQQFHGPRRSTDAI